MRLAWLIAFVVLPTWAAPFATCLLPEDPRITACDYEDTSTGETARISVEIDTQRGDSPGYRVCKFDISHWAPGSAHATRCRSVDIATGEVSAWFAAALDRPASEAPVVALVGSVPPVTPPSQAEVTVFGQAAPTLQSSDDTAAVNLGLRFTPSAAGKVLGVRFYKQVGNGGAHRAALWGADGAQLASATFASESATGWQEVRFAVPVQVAAGGTLTASYLAPQGRYAYTSNAAWPVNVGPLTAVGGAYTYGSSLARPTSSWQSSHYWVDVIFKVD